MKIFSQNRKAFFEYTFSEFIEAGIVLVGDEVKSIRSGHISLCGSYAIISKGELIIINCKITEYKFAYNKEKSKEDRNRKLLVKKKEIKKIQGFISEKRLMLVPTKIYENERGYIKIEIGVGKHKKLHDKKQQLKERDLDREAKRELKEIKE
jgi:SsrA-binding protein